MLVFTASIVANLKVRKVNLQGNKLNIFQRFCLLVLETHRNFLLKYLSSRDFTVK